MLKTFSRGGVHPEENKLTANKGIQVLPIPETVQIPVGQHLGTPAEILVVKGDKVKTGQLLAKAAGFISANIHSSVSGSVEKIDLVIDVSGYRKTVINIKTDGDEWVSTIDKSSDLKKDFTFSSDEIITRIKEAGIVGLGGATFPSNVKLSVPQGKKAEVLCINGVECEPYLTSDHRVMLEKTEEVITGIRLLMAGLNVKKAVIGIENNKKDAIEKMKLSAKNQTGIEVVALKVKYPQGGEKQLIKALIGLEVPSGSLPIQVGAVVFNVGTAFAVYEALQKNKPLFERVVTITGKSVKNPGNYLVRFGTSITKLIEAAGGIPDNCGKIISGGPMMGKALNNQEAPIVKGSSGILLMNNEESKRITSNTCIRCGKCISACPMGIQPYILGLLIEKDRIEETESHRIMDCMECGSCQFTCPSGRPLLDYVRAGKFKMSQIIRKRNEKN